MWRGVSRDGKRRELNEVGVHDEELGGGRSERQMDGEKEHVQQIDASNSSWLLSYLAVSFFKTTWKFNRDCLFQLHLIFACKDQNKNVCLLSFLDILFNVHWNKSLKTWFKSSSAITSIGWTKAFCLSGNVKVHAVHCFFCEGGARANRGWSKGWNEGGVKGWEGRQKLIQTMHIYFVFCLSLCSFPCLFTSPQTCSLPSPSPPFYMSISASTQHLHSCSEDKVLGDKGVKRSEHGWKAERVKWSWGDGQGRDEGLGGGV